MMNLVPHHNDYSVVVNEVHQYDSAFNNSADKSDLMVGTWNVRGACDRGKRESIELEL